MVILFHESVNKEAGSQIEKSNTEFTLHRHV